MLAYFSGGMSDKNIFLNCHLESKFSRLVTAARVLVLKRFVSMNISLKLNKKNHLKPYIIFFFRIYFFGSSSNFNKKKKEMNNPSLKRHKDYPREEEDIGQS